jgi:hypothetical protein
MLRKRKKGMINQQTFKGLAGKSSRWAKSLIPYLAKKHLYCKSGHRRTRALKAGKSSTDALIDVKTSSLEITGN